VALFAISGLGFSNLYREAYKKWSTKTLTFEMSARTVNVENVSIYRKTRLPHGVKSSFPQIPFPAVTFTGDFDLTPEIYEALDNYKASLRTKNYSITTDNLWKFNTLE
jgi:hypothetical protein